MKWLKIARGWKQGVPSEGCLPSEPITLRGTAATLLRRVIGSKQHRLPASAGVLGSNYARACSLLFLNSHPSLVLSMNIFFGKKQFSSRFLRIKKPFFGKRTIHIMYLSNRFCHKRNSATS